MFFIDKFFSEKNWKARLEGEITNPELIKELTTSVEEMPELLRRHIQRTEAISQRKYPRLEPPSLNIEITVFARTKLGALLRAQKDGRYYSAMYLGGVKYKVVSVFPTDEAGR